MEHLIKQTENETIKRFELANKSIWLVRKNKNFGIAQTKKEALKLTETETFYAHQGIPKFISELGSYHKHNNRPIVNSVPGAINFIWGLVPLSWQADFLYRVIVDQHESETYLEICRMSTPEFKPLSYWSNDTRGFYQQLTNCIYQYYIDLEKNEKVMIEQNPKLAEWQKNWYSKLSPRKMK